MAKARRRGRRSGVQRRRATKRWTARDAERALEAWRASGLSLPTWCREEGIGYERVRRWRNQLPARRVRAQTAALLPVRVLEDSPLAVEASGFSLELPRGLRVHVPSGFDAASLARLLRVVEASA